MDKIAAKSNPLNKFSTIKAGLKAYETGKGLPLQTNEMKNDRVYHSNTQKDPSYEKYLLGKDVARYSVDWSGQWLKYGNNLAAPRDSALFEGERILVRQIPSKPPYCINAVYSNERYLNDINSMIVANLKGNSMFLLGILNAKLTSYWFLNKFDKLQRGVFPQFKVKELALFPIPKASDSQRQEIESTVQKILDFHIMLKSKTDQLTLLVKTEFSIENWSNRGGKFWVLDFNDFLSKLGLTKLPLTQKDDLLQLWNKYVPELQELDSKIKQLDQEIDDIVFDLYELTEEEKRIVLESATSNT